MTSMMFVLFVFLGLVFAWANYEEKRQEERSRKRYDEIYRKSRALKKQRNTTNIKNLRRFREQTEFSNKSHQYKQQSHEEIIEKIKPYWDREMQNFYRIHVENAQHQQPQKTTPEEWDITLLKALEWKRFEEVCKEYLRYSHCDASMTCVGADGGVDIRIKDANGKTLALGQCKAYNGSVSVSLVREFYGVMAHENVPTGIFLTTSYFTDDAQLFAKNKKLLLIDGQELVKLMNGLPVDKKKGLLAFATEGDYTTPTCASCDVKMVLRSSNGTPNGRKFWGCRNYPRCRNTLQVRAEQDRLTKNCF